jgi:hypothetical protein
MTKTYKVHYTDWKGRLKTVWLYANSYAEAVESARVIQGLSQLLAVEEEE